MKIDASRIFNLLRLLIVTPSIAMANRIKDEPPPSIHFIPVNVDLDETVSYFLDRHPETDNLETGRLVDLPHFNARAHVFGLEDEEALPYCFSAKAHTMLSCKVTIYGSRCGKKVDDLDENVCQFSTFVNQLQYCIPSPDALPATDVPARFKTCRQFAQRLIAQNEVDMYIKYANMFVRICCNPEASLRYLKLLPPDDESIETNTIENDLSGYVVDDGSAGAMNNLKFIWNIDTDDLQHSKKSDPLIHRRQSAEESKTKAEKSPIESHLHNQKDQSDDNDDQQKEKPNTDPRYILPDTTLSKEKPKQVVRKCRPTKSNTWVCRWLSKVQSS